MSELDWSECECGDAAFQHDAEGCMANRGAKIHCQCKEFKPARPDRWELFSPHPSGPEHGCPYDYAGLETNRLLMSERFGAAEGVSGTFSCPICGKDTPHEHTSQEVASFRVARKREQR